MEEHNIIRNCNGLLTTNKLTTASRVCAENLTKRIIFLSKHPVNGDYVGEWWISGEKKCVDRKLAINNPDTLCLCGHKIEHMYIVTNKDREMVQIGCACAERFMPGKVGYYKRSLKHPFYCDVCKKEYGDRVRHLKTKVHARKEEVFVLDRGNVLRHLMRVKAERYQGSLRVPGSCAICGDVKDMRGHYTSDSHKYNLYAFKTYELTRVVRAKQTQYLESLWVPGCCKLCGRVKDMRGHYTSDSHMHLLDALASARVEMDNHTSRKCIQCPARISADAERWMVRCKKCYAKFSEAQ